VTTPADPDSFSDICGDLPDHQAEVMTGTLTVAEQNARNGGTPAVDRGQDDRAKYATAQVPTWTGAS
jgi:hypothetical protein